MICISLSEEFMRFGQLLKDHERYFIEIVQKKHLSTPFKPSNINNPKLAANLKKIFREMRAELPFPDDNIALALPQEWFDLSHNSVDKGLPPENIAEVLDWNVAKRLGAVAEQKFIQHYPLQSPTNADPEYLSVSYFKNLGKLLQNAAKPAGFKVQIIDINLFSAAAALERLEKIEKNEKWAVWLVGEQKHSLIVIDSGEFRQLVQFEINDPENYSILRSSSADEIGKKIVSEINGIRTFAYDSLSSIDRLYYYSHNVDSAFFNMLLTYDVANLKTINPFENFKPVNMYANDGDGIGAMCQFIDLLGLMFREIPEDA
ncbi:MAG: hypothetical protein J7L86_02430 [Candidatus Marinimicrobia bacterium]|nr:hypothetical protein [Candidatus Neomarinimicrobiota bacterium]